MNDHANTAQPHLNEFGQPIGTPVEGWQAPAPVQTAALTQQLDGQYCRMEKLEAEHAPQLQAAFHQASPSLWTYLPYGPFDAEHDYQNWINLLNNKERKHSFAYCIKPLDSDHVLGVCAYLNIKPDAGSIEIGHLCFSPLLQQTTAATEAIFMMIDAAFMLGYRRVEWKCNDLNIPSIAAAGRFGFRFEGVFRQAMVVKGRNRDTAWFAMTDADWQLIRPCYEAWLSPDNFTKKGKKQKQRLSELTKSAHESRKSG